jgi:transcriptional regulator with XRE-family HTH domain
MRLIGSFIDARRRLGLTQSEVARRAGVSQPAIAALEAGRGNPTLDTLDRWAAALEVEILVAPRMSDPLEEVAAALQGADDALAFRLALDLLDRLRELSPAELVLAASRPPSSGSSRHDALLAAVVELVCLECDVPVPPWCSEPVASPMWWVSPLPSARRHALATCPAPFRARGIMIDESDVVRA